MNDFPGAVDRNLPMLERGGKQRKRGRHFWTGGLTVAVLALGFAMRWLT